MYAAPSICILQFKAFCARDGPHHFAFGILRQLFQLPECRILSCPCYIIPMEVGYFPKRLPFIFTYCQGCMPPWRLRAYASIRSAIPLVLKAVFAACFISGSSLKWFLAPSTPVWGVLHLEPYYCVRPSLGRCVHFRHAVTCVKLWRDYTTTGAVIQGGVPLRAPLPWP